MDVVYLLANSGSAWNNNEIKYSLRSVELYLKNYDRIFLIGEKPKFLNNQIIHIKHRDDMRLCKERRIMEKIKFACTIPEISDEFLFFNDDYFLLEDIDAQKVDYYYKGILSQKMLKKKTNDAYAISMMNTINVLLVAGLETKHFDIHYPIVYSKGLFPEIMDKYDWTIKQGYVIKSLYCNTLKMEGAVKQDCKINLDLEVVEVEEKINGQDLFSTKAYMSPKFKAFIEKRYPQKSKYEL